MSDRKPAALCTRTVLLVQNFTRQLPVCLQVPGFADLSYLPLIFGAGCAKIVPDLQHTADRRMFLSVTLIPGIAQVIMESDQALML